ncbi:hypothetical protein YC2023_087013 [Brassica napus]
MIQREYNTIGVTLLKASPARFVATRLLAQRYDIPFHSCANLYHTVPCPNYPELVFGDYLAAFVANNLLLSEKKRENIKYGLKRLLKMIDSIKPSELEPLMIEAKFSFSSPPPKLPVKTSQLLFPVSHTMDSELNIAVDELGEAAVVRSRHSPPP